MPAMAGGVGDLVERRGPDQSHQHDAQAGPNGISHADRNCFQSQRQKIEGRCIAGDDQQAGCQPRELLRCFQCAGGDHFGDDGDQQINEMHVGLRQIRLFRRGGGPKQLHHRELRS